MVEEKRPGAVDESEWALESGLPDDIDYWVTDSFFGYDPEYMGGSVPLLLWDGESPDVELTRHIAWALGKDWTITGDGRYVEHPKKKSFVRTSIVGRLIERVTKELGVPMHEYGSPRDASVWIGHGFHLVREDIEFKGAVERGILVDRGGKTQHLMPSEYLGYREEVGKAPAVAITGELEAKLAEMAKANDLKAFQLAASNLSEVKGRDDLMADVLDSSAGGYWSRHRAA